MHYLNGKRCTYPLLITKRFLDNFHQNKYILCAAVDIYLVSTNATPKNQNRTLTLNYFHFNYFRSYPY